MTALKQILAASRADLVDGFPVRAVIVAMQSSAPLDKLNELLKPHMITVELSCNNNELGVNPFVLKLGINIGSYLAGSGEICISLNERFFDPSVSTVIIKALTFQSVCVHQLVHRDRKHDSCRIHYQTFAASINDEHELEAMGAGLAHDIRCKGIISVTGNELLQQLSPRLANIMAYSGSFQPGSITKLQEHIRNFSEVN